MLFGVGIWIIGGFGLLCSPNKNVRSYGLMSIIFGLVSLVLIGAIIGLAVYFTSYYRYN